MKKQRSRELLLTTKAAQKWDAALAFDENVDALLQIVKKMDDVKQTERATEVMDVYGKKHTPVKYLKRKTVDADNRPFEFLVYCN